ncbi:PREDICTED: protein dachsous-like [Priapulus caudatus]|uniref:Protein dachsous-like n=1 Tax=Priapulus caudatus TaxID=37621 RepID=A0ABM1EKC7_PRICU|nr:PREDICTED: protein dachsous-like [Priapulus caudatus]
MRNYRRAPSSETSSRDSTSGAAEDGDGGPALDVNKFSGEIRTRRPLDRETADAVTFVAFLVARDPVKVIVRVRDVNDHAPAFPVAVTTIRIAESARRNHKESLSPARDPDADAFTVQLYEIAAGNVNETFRLGTRRKNGVLYPDLELNGRLDRERVPRYRLTLAARDGGDPPRAGETTVEVVVVDVNDNRPAFERATYEASVAENATAGTTVTRVVATDADEGENARVTYSIRRGGDDAFAVDARTGAVTLRRALPPGGPREHVIVVSAADGGTPSLVATAHVAVTVVGVRARAPRVDVAFVTEGGGYRVREDTAARSVVARVSISDPDRDDDEDARLADVDVTLEGADGAFALRTEDRATYWMYVARALDRETTPEYNLTVVARAAARKGAPAVRATADIAVVVDDANDNAPRFESALYEASVEESADVGAFVARVGASDDDAGDNAAVTYSLAPPAGGAAVDWFAVDAATGLITTTAKVDCLIDARPEVVVVATDGGEPALSSRVVVRVSVVDVNDHEPQFSLSFYNVSVSEGATVGKCILQLNATDGDCGVNAIVNYTLVEAAAARANPRPFTIDGATGQLCLQRPLDHEQRDSYEFSVIATDAGGRSASVTVHVHVADENDNAPVFYPREYGVSLKAGAPPGGAVVRVHASDGDAGAYGRVTYAVADGDDADGAGVFVVDGNSVVVVDVNDNRPAFERATYEASVAENATAGTTVTRVVATDADEGENARVTYSIRRGGDDAFAVDARTGAVTLRRALPPGGPREHVIVVSAADGGTPSLVATAHVAVTVVGVRARAPRVDVAFVTEGGGYRVREDTAARSVVARVSISDPDRDDDDAARLADVDVTLEGADGAFALRTEDRATYWMYVARALDRETTPEYNLTVVARAAARKGAPAVRATADIAVVVDDANDNAPRFESALYEASVEESADVGAFVARVGASDDDAGDNAAVTYSLAPPAGGAAVDWFAVDAATGLITTTAKVDCLIDARPEVVVVATDGGEPALSSRVVVRVSVVDVNDHEPQFSLSFYNVSVSEGATVGKCILQLNATDGDCGVNAIVNYTLVEAAAAARANPRPFTIDGATGQLCLQRPLDHEQRDSYEFSVIATDAGGRSASVTVHVHVADENDNAPVFYPREYGVSLKAGAPPGGAVVRVHASDGDAGAYGRVTYAVADGDDADGAGVFVVDGNSGAVTLAKKLEATRTNRHVITVTATDGGGRAAAAPAVVTVSVVAGNQKPPVFRQPFYGFSIPEDYAVGSRVGFVHAEGGAAVHYSISSGDPGRYFAIDAQTGEISSARALDREEDAFLLLAIQARAGEPPTYGHAQHMVGSVLSVEGERSRQSADVSLWPATTAPTLTWGERVQCST